MMNELKALWADIRGCLMLPVAIWKWWRAPEPREPYDIDAEVDLLPHPNCRCVVRELEPTGPGHRALHDLPPMPNSLRRFAYAWGKVDGKQVPLFFDQSYPGQPMYRMDPEHDKPLYL
jgi:hypothetical protein